MNRNLGLAKRLKLKKERDKLHKYLIEGFHLIEEAVKSEEIEFIFYTEKTAQSSTLAQAKNRKIPCLKISSKDAKNLADTETHQGVFAVITKRESELVDFLKNKDSSVIVYCHEIQDPGNLGAIIRTADSTGVAGVVLSKGCVDVYNPKVLRSGMGSTFHLPVVSNADIETLKVLKEKDYKVICTAGDAEIAYFDADFTGKMVLVFGNEGAGISSEVSKIANQIVRIPIFGRAESLNVAASVAIILYEIARLRWKKN